MNDAPNPGGSNPRRASADVQGSDTVQASGVLAPFGIRNYRFQWPADLLTSWAFEMETLILGWYVLAETGSVLLLTLFAALQYLGTLIGPVFGVAGDRIGPRNLLCLMRAAYAVLAVSLAAVIFGGGLSPLAVFAIAMLNGIVRPSDMAVRSALVAEIMPPPLLIRAMSISRTTTDSARMFGALAGTGLFAALGLLPAYLVVAGLYALGLAFTLCVRGRQAPVSDGNTVVTVGRPSPWHDLKEGMVYIWNTPSLLAALWVAFLVNLTAYPLTNGLLPYVARNVYHIDQAGLGYLAAGFALGALIGSIALIMARRIFPLAPMMIVSALLWYVALLVFAQMHTAVGGTVMLILAGFVQSLCLVPLAVILLRTSSEALRGRVMGVRMLAIYGLPVGLLTAGVLIDRIGFYWMLTAYSLFGLVCIIGISVYWRAEIWERQAPANVV